MKRGYISIEHINLADIGMIRKISQAEVGSTSCRYRQPISATLWPTSVQTFFFAWGPYSSVSSRYSIPLLPFRTPLLQFPRSPHPGVSAILTPALPVELSVAVAAAKDTPRGCIPTSSRTVPVPTNFLLIPLFLSHFFAPFHPWFS